MNTSQPRHPQSGARQAITITTAAVGGLALVFSLGSTALAAGTSALLGSNHGSDSSQSGGSQGNLHDGDSSDFDAIDFSEISKLEVDADLPGKFEVSFDDGINEAEFSVRDKYGDDATNRWSVNTDNQTLHISAEGSEIESWFNIDGPFVDSHAEYTAQLVLPGVYNDGSVDFELSGSALLAQVDGNFRSVESDVSAGKFVFNGSAPSFDAEVGAGELDATVADVDTLKLEVATGKASATLTGTTPSQVKVDVAVGAADVTLPKASYNVTTEASVGTVKNNLTSSKSSPNTVRAEVATGQITLNER